VYFIRNAASWVPVAHTCGEKYKVDISIIFVDRYPSSPMELSVEKQMWENSMAYDIRQYFLEL
jgi:hypothetical protein